jgi:hypothetical protein
MIFREFFFSIGESAMPILIYIQNANLPKSRIPSTPSLLPTRDLPAVSIPIHYSFVTLRSPLFIRDRTKHMLTCTIILFVMCR